jgi:hypothetical protein
MSRCKVYGLSNVFTKPSYRWEGPGRQVVDAATRYISPAGLCIDQAGGGDALGRYGNTADREASSRQRRAGGATTSWS